jgi:hypothetical protein
MHNRYPVTVSVIITLTIIIFKAYFWCCRPVLLLVFLSKIKRHIQLFLKIKIYLNSNNTKKLLIKNGAILLKIQKLKINKSKGLILSLITVNVAYNKDVLL